MGKYVLTLLFLAFASFISTDATRRSSFETGLLHLVEKSKSGDVRSLSISVPSLNPLTIPPVTIDREGYIMSLTKLTVRGLETLSIKKLSTNLNDFSMSVEIAIPALVVTADRYHLQAGHLWFVKLVNDVGRFKCRITNLVGRVSVKFGVDGRNTVIKKLHLDYSIQNVKVELSGSSSFVNSSANGKFWNVINDKQLARKIERFVKERARPYLQGHTPKDFIEIISKM